MAKKIDITKRGLTPAQNLAPDETINPDSIESGTVVDTSKKNPSATLTNGSGTSRLDSVIADKLSAKALETAGRAVALSEELNLSLQQMQELEASIREQLAKEKTERQIKDEDLQQQITEERRRATEAEGSLYELSGDITYNGTNPASSLVDAVNKEAKRRQEEDKALDKRITDSSVQLKDLIDAEATEREKADAAIVKQTEDWFVEQHNEIGKSLAAETTRATEAETRLSSSLEEEKQRAITKENALGGEIAKNSDRIDNLTTTVEDTCANLFSEMEALRTAHKEDIDNLNVALSDETERSKAADTELSGKIDDEVARAKAAEKQVNDDLITEMQIRAQQDATLQNSVNTLNSNLNSLGVELQAKLGAEENARKQADLAHDNELNEHEMHLGSLDNRLEQEIQDRKDADGDLDTLVTENRDNLVSAINELHSDLENEVNRATTTEGNLGALETEDNTDLVSAINSEVNRAKTTEGELENLTTEANENLVSAINEVQKELEDEISNRTSTTDDLDKRLKQEATDREAADNTLTENLNKEIEDRKQAVTDEQEARETEDKSIRDALTAETTRATGVEDKLREDLTTETSNRTAADATLQTNIDREADTREEVDTQLQSNITAEETTRKDEITRVEGLITAEKERATGVESGLDTKISDETTRATGREGKLDAAITAEQTRAEKAEQALTDNLNSEIERATSEEGRIDKKLGSEIERAKNVEGDLESLTPPATNLAEALNKEYTRATEAEGDLDSRLTQEIKDREAADANLQNSLTTDFDKKLQEEKDRATKAEQANTAAIEAEVNRAAGVEGTLTDLKTSNKDNLVSALNSEVDRATAAEEANATNITKEEDRATKAEGDLQSAIEEESKTRESKDTALGERIDDLSSSLDTNTSDLEQKITAEQKRAEAAEKKNADAITAEEARAKGVESSLQTALSAAKTDLTALVAAEETRATKAEEGLQSSITTLTEKSAASVDLSLSTTDYTLTVTLKNQAGTSLSTKTVDLPLETNFNNAVYDEANKQITFTCVNGTTVNVKLADLISELATSAELSAEAKAREDADTALGKRIDTLSSSSTAGLETKQPLLSPSTKGQIVIVVRPETTNNADTDATRSLTVEKTVDEDDVSTLKVPTTGVVDSKVSAATTSLQEKITAEETRATGKEEELLGKITAEVTRAQGVEGELGDLTTSADNLVDAINKEAEARSAADQAATTALANETSARNTAISGLQTSLTEEVERAKAAEKANENNITALNTETTKLSAKDTELEGSIAAEAKAREGADADLQEQIEALSKSSEGLEAEIARAKAEEAKKVDKDGGDLTDTVVSYKELTGTVDTTIKSGDKTSDIVAKLKKRLDDADTSGIHVGDALLTSNNFGGKKLYISKMDDFFYAADKRWTVTAEIRDAETDEKISDVAANNIAALFNGRNETVGIDVKEGQKAVILMDFGSKIPGYPYGHFYLSFYAGRVAKTVDGKPQVKMRMYDTQNDTGWVEIDNAKNISKAPATTMVVDLSNSAHYYTSKIEFIVYGKGTESNDNVTTGITKLTGIEFSLNRVDGIGAPNPFIGKYAAETLYYPLTAPEFIEGGQSLKDKYAGKTTTENALKLKYEKPSTGIPESDLSADLKSAVAKAKASASSTELSAEASARASGDSTNATAIEAEVNRAAGVEGTLTDLKTSNKDNLVSALNSEVDRATAAEEANATNITKEEDRATKAEGDLQSAIEEESKTRESKDTALGERIDDLSSSLDTNTSDLEQKITAEQKRAEAAEKKNADAITAEEARAKGVESSLQTALSAAKTDLTALVAAEETRATKAEEGLQSSITTLTEKSAASVDLSLSTTDYTLTVTLKNQAGTSLSTKTVDLPLETNFNNAVYDEANKQITFTCVNGTTVNVKLADLISELATSAELSAEAKAREDADTALGKRIDTLSSSSTAGLETKQPLLSPSTKGQIVIVVRPETTNNADTDATRSLTVEKTVDEDDVSTLKVPTTGVVDSKVSAATTSLQEKITAEETRATGKEEELLGKITAEVTRAQGVEGELGDLTTSADNLVDAINKEAEARSAADQAATTALANETSARNTAISGLQTSLTEEVERAKAAEKANENNITALNTETTKLSAKDTELEGSIAAEAKAREGADADLQEQIEALSKSSEGLEAEIARAKAEEAKKVDKDGGDLTDTVVSYKELTGTVDTTIKSGDKTSDIVAKLKKRLDDADTSGIHVGDALLTSNNFGGKKLYISKMDDFFYAADKRWTVTAEIRDAETDEKISDVAANNIAALFNGRNETVGIDVKEGQKAVILMDFGSKIPGYPYGHFYLSFYAGRVAKTVDGKPQVKMRMYDTQNDTGWVEIDNAKNISKAPATTMVVDLSNSAHYYTSKIEFIVYGKGTESNDNVTTGITKLTGIEFSLNRVDGIGAPNPFIGKYAAETLYYPLTAPEFIEGGQSLKDKYAGKTTTENALKLKYEKPSTGIPESDLSADLKSAVAKAKASASSTELSAEASARASGDSTNATAIAAETSRAKGEEKALQTAIDEAEKIIPADVGVSLDSTTYKLTIKLIDSASGVIGTAKTIDLPIESMVVSGSYDNAKKQITLTLQNKQTISFSVADLISGLAADKLFTESGASKGLVSSPVAKEGKFLRDDGTWQIPANTNTWRQVNIQDAAGESLGSLSTATGSGVLTIKQGDNVTLAYASGVVTISAVVPNLTDYVLKSSLSKIATSGLLADATGDATHRVITDAERTTWNAKQNALTFDTTPKQDSKNPVTSGGLYTALSGKLTSVTATGGITATPSGSTVALKHSNSITQGTISEGGTARTLAAGGKFNIPSITYDANGHITSVTTTALTLPADKDTHYTTGLFVGATGEKENAATTNGSTFIKLYDNDTRRANLKITGASGVSVASDESGNITITGPGAITAPGNGTLTVKGANGLSGSGTFTANQSTAATITISHAGKQSTLVDLAAADRTYVKSLTFDAYGHVTGYTTGKETVTNTDTHYTTHLYVGATGTAASGATTNGNTYLKLYDNATAREEYKIYGKQNVTVTSESTGAILITGPDLSGYAKTSDLSGYSKTGHTHDYLPLTGGDLTGALSVQGTVSVKNSAGTSTAASINQSGYVTGTWLATTAATDLNSKPERIAVIGTKEGAKNYIYWRTPAEILSDIGAAASGHTHTGYASSSHTHAMTDISGLSAALEGKASVSALTALQTRVDTFFDGDTLEDALDTLHGLQAALDNDASFAATMTTELAGKAAKDHTHTNMVTGSSLTANAVILGSGSSAIKALAAGTAGQVLALNDSKVPYWKTLTDNDTRVTSAANHYAPTAVDTAKLTANASSTTAASWNSTQLVTGVTLTRDDKGHVTGLSVSAVKMPANPNSNSTTHLYIGATGTAASGATSNGATYLKLYDDSTSRHSYKISGTQNVSVASDASGNLTITGPNLSGYSQTGHTHAEYLPLDGSKAMTGRLVINKAGTAQTGADAGHIALQKSGTEYAHIRLTASNSNLAIESKGGIILYSGADDSSTEFSSSNYVGFYAGKVNASGTVDLNGFRNLGLSGTITHGNATLTLPSSTGTLALTTHSHTLSGTKTTASVNGKTINVVKLSIS